MADGTLRADLYHRLSVLPIKIPPLRERAEDILPIARAWLAEVASRLDRDPPRLTADAEDALVRYHWPGNVRELRHVLERMLLAGVGHEISNADLPIEILEGKEAYLAPGVDKRPTLEDVERRYIELTLTFARGNQTRAAAILGISRKALWEKRKRFGSALTRTGDALLAAVLAPACACCHRTLDAPLTVRCASMLAGRAPGGRELQRGPARASFTPISTKGRRSLTKPLGALLRERSAGIAGRCRLRGSRSAVSWRRLARGFNPAGTLARQLGVTVLHALWRVRSTSVANRPVRD